MAEKCIIRSMLFFEVLKNIFRFTPEHQDELTKSLTSLEASRKELEALRSRVSLLERQNSSLWSQVTEKERRLGEAKTEIAVTKQQQSRDKEMTSGQIKSLQNQITGLLTDIGDKTTALFQAKCESSIAKSNEANLQKLCDELKMQKQELETRNNNTSEEKVKTDPSINIKQEPGTERKLEENPVDNIKVKVEFADQRPRSLGVFGLSSFTREWDLEKAFRGFGSLEGVNIVKDHITGRSKGYGFVKFLSPVSLNCLIDF